MDTGSALNEKDPLVSPVQRAHVSKIYTVDQIPRNPTADIEHYNQPTTFDLFFPFISTYLPIPPLFPHPPPPLYKRHPPPPNNSAISISLHTHRV
ncbi:hypothetical protein L2E82_05643 [Cichorium intybus]|uniref:Uncharacterized protein n=1 Tax=Cichorium intybus TaxID=13427 RepID=A0ACB9H9D9_CICIN|nr:hypothetical protein L2E82_05643 [Cichorium intybus]